MKIGNKELTGTILNQKLVNILDLKPLPMEIKEGCQKVLALGVILKNLQEN